MAGRRPQPIAEIPAGFCRDLRYVFTDLDDTLTASGQLPPETYAMLWRLHRAGIRVVIVTGRPAGWCDHLARMWPVDGVVGENGAFFFAYERDRRRMDRRYLLSVEERAEGQRRLARVRERALAEVPGCAVAADQPYRIADLAIDFSEDVPPLPMDAVRRIAAIAREEGATAKISSIHVNCWYGDFDKVACVRFYLRERAGLDWDAGRSHALFAGDSPNDEPMFAGMDVSIGVANLTRYLDDMTHLPTYLTRAEAAAGFCEAGEIILARRD
jgi:HAD superfamily hydrolase (TIGR01484 family)